jgi:hypothetical protein
MTVNIVIGRRFCAERVGFLFAQHKPWFAKVEQGLLLLS